MYIYLLAQTPFIYGHEIMKNLCGDRFLSVKIRQDVVYRHIFILSYYFIASENCFKM